MDLFKAQILIIAVLQQQGNSQAEQTFNYDFAAFQANDIPEAELETPLAAEHVETGVDNTVSESDDEPLAYARDDEDFLQIVPKTFSHYELFDWEPAPLLHGDPNEPGFMGRI